MRLIILSLILLLTYSSCEEIGPTINIIPPERKVLVEEFTGVQCVNCPEGAEKLEALLQLHGQNLIVVSIHAGFFSMPHSTSDLDFRTPFGDALDAYLGPVTFYPSAVINRKIFEGENSRIINSNKWAGLIQQELTRVSPLELTLESSYDVLSRELDITVNMNFFEDFQQPVHISVLVTETDLVDSQLGLDGLEEDYIHRHVLREMLTNFDGQPVNNPNIANSPIENRFAITLPDEWIAANCSVVAFTHLISPEFEVLQAEEVKVIQ